MDLNNVIGSFGEKIVEELLVNEGYSVKRSLEPWSLSGLVGMIINPDDNSEIWELHKNFFLRNRPIGIDRSEKEIEKEAKEMGEEYNKSIRQLFDKGLEFPEHTWKGIKLGWSPGGALPGYDNKLDISKEQIETLMEAVSAKDFNGGPLLGAGLPDFFVYRTNHTPFFAEVKTAVNQTKDQTKKTFQYTQKIVFSILKKSFDVWVYEPKVNLTWSINKTKF
jgi:hypothetical protein